MVVVVVEGEGEGGGDRRWECAERPTACGRTVGAVSWGMMMGPVRCSSRRWPHAPAVRAGTCDGSPAASSFIAYAAPVAAGTCWPRLDLTYIKRLSGDPMCMGSCRPFVGSNLLWQHWFAASSNDTPRQKVAPSSRYCGQTQSWSCSAAPLPTEHASSPRLVK